MKNQILQGDCLEVLKTLESESVDCVVTSPPYWALRDYGTAQWEGGDENCAHIQDINATKKFGNEEFNVNRPSRENTKTGNYYYKDICLKCGAKRIDKQLGLEPTFQEYINKLCDIFDEVKRVLKKDGTCWVNLGDTYSGMKIGNDDLKNLSANTKTFIKPKSDIREKSLLQIPSRFAIEMTNRGWILRNEIIWHKPNCMPSSATDRFTVDFEKVFFFVKSKKYYFEQQFEKSIWAESDKRFGKDKVLSKGKSQTNNYAINGVAYRLDGLKNKRTVWSINTKPYKEAHFAVYPDDLIKPMILSGCPEGGIVLDPFFGSGTTGNVAKRLNRNYLGIELNPEYIKMAEKRIGEIGDLFFI